MQSPADEAGLFAIGYFAIRSFADWRHEGQATKPLKPSRVRHRPRVFLRKWGSMRLHPVIVDTTYDQKFLHMGLPPLKTRENYGANLGGKSLQFARKRVAIV
jgi:hypothetical protein